MHRAVRPVKSGISAAGSAQPQITHAGIGGFPRVEFEAWPHFIIMFFVIFFPPVRILGDSINFNISTF